MNSNEHLINGQNYNILGIAKWFHNLTHFNVKLQPIKNTTFDLENEEYVQSLLVFTALPLAALVLILLVYLIYSIFICVCGTTDKRKNIPKTCKVFIFLFGLVCGASFVVGLYGSWKMHSGTDSVHNSTEHAVNLFNSVKIDTKNLSKSLNIGNDIRSLKEDIRTFNDDALNSLTTHLDRVLDYSNGAIREVDKVYARLTKLDVDSVPQMIEKYENIRWIVTICILCALAVVAFAYTFGIYLRCLLAVLTAFGVISLIISSAIVAISFGATVGISDFCFQAKPYIKSQMNNMVEKALADYYIECYGHENPNGPSMDEAKHFLEDATQQINLFGEGINVFLDNFCQAGLPVCPPNIQQDINTSTANIKSNLTATERLVFDISNLVDCQQINYDLNESLDSICTDILEGLVMILSNGIAASLCFAILVFCATYALR